MTGRRRADAWCTPRRRHRTGRSDPQQEGPADLRLVPPALAAWAARRSAWTLPAGEWRWPVARPWARGVRVAGGRGRGAGRSVSGCGLRGRTGERRAVVAGHARRAAGRAAALSRRWSAGAFVALAAVLLCAAAGAASAGLHAADLRRGPVPALAEQYAGHRRGRGDRRPTADPAPGARRPTDAPGTGVRRPRPSGSRRRTVRSRRTRRRSLVVVTRSAEAVGRRARPRGRRRRGGPARSAWRGLLPSDTGAGDGAAAPPLVAGATGSRPCCGCGPPRAPPVVGEPSGTQRLAGRLRAGLREATDGLPAGCPGAAAGAGRRGHLAGHARAGRGLQGHRPRRTCSPSPAATSRSCSPCSSGRPASPSTSSGAGWRPASGVSLRATALLGGALTLGFVVVCRPDPSVLRAAACGADRAARPRRPAAAAP